MLRKEDFDDGIKIITAVFGEAPIKGSRLMRIKSLCQGRVSGEGFIEICENICDNFRQIPLPSDFDKAVLEWRKNFREFNGYQYSDQGKNLVIEAQYLKFDCSKCNDLGYVRITHRVPSDFETLMFCDCGRGSDSASMIPEWDNSLSGAFSKGPCPNEWFKPDIKDDEPDDGVYSKIQERLNFWKRKIKDAEKHWKQLRSA